MIDWLMTEGLTWLGMHRSDLLLGLLVVALSLNTYTFFEQRRVLKQLRQMLLRARYNGFERRQMVLNGVGHRYPSPRIVGSDGDDC